MSNVLIIIKGKHQGNRMFDPDDITYDEQFFESNIETLDVFCEEIIKVLKERFENASKFPEEVDSIRSQFETRNFAQVKFNFASSTYNVTIVAPKFE